jgi:hypothetical protein
MHKCYRTFLYRQINDRGIKEHGTVGGMKTGKGNQVLEKNLASVPLCSSQLPQQSP